MSEKAKCTHEYQTIPEGKYGVCIHCEKQVKINLKEDKKYQCSTCEHAEWGTFYAYFKCKKGRKSLKVTCKFYEGSENKKIIEIPFNSEKEKLIMITRKYLTTEELTAILDMLEAGKKANIILLPSELVEEVKVVKRVDTK
jgi:hypothetical protein